LDVLAYRVYHRLFLSVNELAYERRLLNQVAEAYAPPRPDLPRLVTSTPNSSAARAFLDELRPDLMIARCKVILKPEIFAIPRLGTYVMHPGICPEYRNAHGCFWALSKRDLGKVGMTLLKVDKGIDTGPIFGFFSYPFDERADSHVVIQHRTVFDNLDQIRDTLLEIEKGTATPIDTSGRRSGVWGQPWLTRYLAWKYAARKRSKRYETDIAALS
jgi:methionyl-tRNA formyltransferase